MPPESGESRPRLTKAQTAGAPPPEHEQLPCPRCDSTNTKFCYYNNYNFSQPRHFCKSCRRYWTQGGTLRDIPIGGGTRKSAKRSRTTNVSSTATSSVHASPTTAVVAHSFPFSSAQLLSPAVQFGVNGGGINEVKGSANGLCGSFTSLLNTQGPTFLALGGLGLGTGFEENGFGLGRGVWALGGLGDGAAGVAGSGGAAAGIGNPWQFEGGEGGFVGGDCFAWPDLAISTPGSGLK